jgi:ATP-binding cassette subfamily B protein
VFAKLATIAVPFTFKWATDALAGQSNVSDAPSWLGWVLLAPILMTVIIGVMRITMAIFTQMRDGVFANVSMNAVRRLAFMVFEHMHLLSLRFHLERKTGGLTRVLERGRNAIETIVRMVLLQAVPTVIELSMVVVVLLYQFDWRYVASSSQPRSAIRSTLISPRSGIGIRCQKNDTILTPTCGDDLPPVYETVKYFVAEN